MNIDEMIADAQAEEEAKKELTNMKAVIERPKRKTEEVTISLHEYLILRQKEVDMDRLFDAVIQSLELSYNNSYLYIKNDEKIMDTIKILFAPVYDALYEQKKAMKEGETD